jgi:phenylacetic acid degradation operon negative regulatory protein
VVDARSALFDLYGDHLRSRGGQAPVAALVRLLASLGIAAPAVRTAISRMVRQGWLEPVRVPAGAGYALTPRAVRRLDEAAERIYRPGGDAWDGGWHLVVVERVRERARRDRVQASLRYLGYAQLDETTWLSPRASSELQALREAERIRVEPFAACWPGPGIWTAWPGLTSAGWARPASWSGRSARARPTRPCSRPAAGSCTSGGSSCSGTRGCPPSCFPSAGRARRRQSSST